VNNVEHVFDIGIDNDTDEHKSTKPVDLDWHMVEDDLPISGSHGNVPSRPSLTSNREFLVNNDVTRERPTTSFYLTRFEQQQRKTLDKDESPSSYFPSTHPDTIR
jgi:hypothetical protein